MTKREEYRLKFYKQLDPEGAPVYILDASAAANQYKGLIFIEPLADLEIEGLISTISAIQNGQPYDHDFLTESEIYSVFNVTFSNPQFSVGGVQTIHMNDLKILLQEWQSFIRS